MGEMIPGRVVFQKYYHVIGTTGIACTVLRLPRPLSMVSVLRYPWMLKSRVRNPPVTFLVLLLEHMDR